MKNISAQTLHKINKIIQKELGFEHLHIRLHAILLTEKNGKPPYRESRGSVYFNEPRRYRPYYLYEIVIFRNNRELFDSKHVTHKKYEDFFSSLGMEITDMVDMVAVLLHEYGHIDFVNTFIQRNEYDKLIQLAGINRSSVELTYKLNEEIGTGTAYSHLLIEELYADSFVMRKFLTIWNKLKEMKIVCK